MTSTASSRSSLVVAALIALIAMPALSNVEIVENLEVFGDLRGRYEGFYYEEDGVRDRNRGRYRVRLGLTYTVNDYFAGTFRMASGSEPDSRNETFGGDEVFGPDELGIDQAFISVKPFGEGDVPASGGQLSAMLGKTPNPFRSKIGKDLLIWDGDITPEGGSITYAISPLEILDLNLDTAFYILDENADGSDPEVFAVQLDTTLRPTDFVDLGGSVSFYNFSSLKGISDTDDDDDALDFFDRGGSIPGGLTDGTKVNLIDFRGSARFNAFEDWPILIYGNVVTNLSAEKAAGFGKEDTAWSIGAEVGDKKKILKVGAAWLETEANSVIVLLSDADPFDGDINRETVMIYASKEILKNTDIGFQLFGTDILDDDIDDDEKAKRWRLQVDVNIRF